MTERIHSDGDIRITARTEHLWLYFYQSWAGSLTREVRVTGRIWWNPATWFSGEHWEKEGEVDRFTVRFFRDAGIIPPERLNPSGSTDVGFRRISISFAHIGWSGGRTPSGGGIGELGTDARSVVNVVIEYIVNGELHTLSHR